MHLVTVKQKILPRGESYEMPALADWLEKIIQLLDIDKFYFLSHSWGSFAALFYLYIHPARVRDMILLDGGYQTKRLRKRSMEEEIAHYESDFEDSVETWEEFLDVAVYGDSRRSVLLDIAAKDLALKKGTKFHWHARGKTAGHIIRGMHKDEAEAIYDKLTSKTEILLLRATLPKSEDNYRNLTANIFRQKTGASVKLIPNTSHMLHWDNPEVVIKEIKERWQ
jgi:pimeloyl-ACP methyl ester carboxylesterase